jgi:branched-chain amino acid transport system permease protein
MDALLSSQLLVAALVTGGLYALVALGLNLIYGTMRLLNIAHGEIVMIGAYLIYWIGALTSLHPLIGAALTAGLCGLLGLAAYYGLFRVVLGSPRLMERVEANSLLLFFGLSIVLQNLVKLAFTASPRSYQPFENLIHFAGASLTGGRAAALCLTLLVCIAMTMFLRSSLFGLSIRALIQSREAAAIVGINIGRVQALSFFIGFAAAGLAGALVGMIEQITPFIGFPFTISAFVVIILGGLGNLAGSLAAGLLLGVLETYGVALTSSNYRSILLYGVFILVLLIRPQGLFGRRSAA